MTAQQEQETLDSLKSIAISLQTLVACAQAAMRRYQIPPPAIVTQREAALRESRRSIS